MEIFTGLLASLRSPWAIPTRPDSLKPCKRNYLFPGNEDPST